MAFLEFLFGWGQYFLLAFAIGFPLHFLVWAMARGRRWVGSLGVALFIPGAILHELGHAIACLLTGKRITGTDFGTNPRKTGGGAVDFEYTGVCTPLAMHAIAYAPVVSCGIGTAAILNYISLNQVAFELLDSAIWFYLLISVASGAAPSTQDMKVAFRSLSARPRVTAVEIFSLGWPLVLPDLLGLASDMALLVYLIAMVLSYIILWKILVSPHPQTCRHGHGLRPSLPGDGRDPRGERWPTFNQGDQTANQGLNATGLPRQVRSPRDIDVPLHVATAEDVYRAAGIKIKSKKLKRELEALTDV